MIGTFLRVLYGDPARSADGVTRCRYCDGTTFERYWLRDSETGTVTYGHTVRCTGCQVTYLRTPGNQRFFEAIGWGDEENPPPVEET